jgi:hypothetical protein
MENKVHYMCLSHMRGMGIKLKIAVIIYECKYLNLIVKLFERE